MHFTVFQCFVPRDHEHRAVLSAGLLVAASEQCSQPGGLEHAPPPPLPPAPAATPPRVAWARADLKVQRSLFLQTVKSLRLPRGRRGFTERWRRAPAKRDSVQGAGVPGRGGEKGFVRGAEAWLSPSPNGVTVGGISEPPSPQPWEWE